MKNKSQFQKDIEAALAKDPAATSKLVVRLTYPGVKALRAYRRAHRWHVKGHPVIARIISQIAARRTGIEIHPGATIGEGLFIDHGHGVVIGETAEIGNNVVIYQGVTLGGTGKDTGKRHPTIKDNVMISAGAKILGPITIGEGSKIGAGAVVLRNVPDNCTVVGVPGRIVRMHGKKFSELDQKLPDPILEELTRLNQRISKIEQECGIESCKYSITLDSVNASYITNDNDDITQWDDDLQ